MKLLRVTLKDLKILFKDKGTLVILFIQPLAFIIIMSLALGQSFNNLNNTNPVRVLLVNNDGQGVVAAKLLANFEGISNSGELKFEQKDPTGEATLTEEKAQQLVKERKRAMAVIIPAGFSEAVQNGQKVTVNFVTDPAASQQVVKPVQGIVQSVLGQTVNPFLTQQSLTQSLSGSLSPEQLAQVNQQVAQTLQAQSGTNIVALAPVNPVGVSAPKYPSVYQQNVPGYTIMYVFFIVTTMAQSILAERKDGTFRRLLAAPIGRFSLLMGKFLPYYIVALIQVTILFLVGRFVFGMDLGENIAGLVLITLALAACAVSAGLLVAAFVKTDQQVNGIGILVLITAALGGCLVPLVFMPAFMAEVAKFTPHGWALIGYQDVMVRGAGLMDVLPTFGVLLAFAGVFFLVAVSRFRFN
jgi:ABC-2 type transport system permease protein